MGEQKGTVIFGRYRLLEILGAGGMGRVWLGHDELIGREVAIKEILPPAGLSDEQRRLLGQRAIREARAAGRLNHPGIVTVHDVIEHDGAPAIIMEYVRGRSLADAIRAEGALPVERVAAIAAAMLAALGVAHEAGIVHRDLKPANVLLDGDRVVITDFGIASLAGDVQLTGSGMVLGTPAYMAPEQAEHERATPASDLWSLGATLYAAVEGRPPFAGDSVMAVLSALLTRDPAPPRRAGRLAPLLAALLRKDPRERPTLDQAARLLAGVAGAGATLEATRQAVPGGGAPTSPGPFAGPPPPAGPYAGPATRTRPAAGRRWRTGLYAVAGALAVIVVAVLLSDPGEGERNPPPAAGGANPARTSGSTISGQAGTGASGTPVELTDAIRLNGHQASVTSVAFSPDGRLLASGDGDLNREGPKTRLWDATSGKLRSTLVGPAGLGGASADAVAFSPDGRLLASGGNFLGDSTRLWRVADRRLVGAFAGSRSIMKSLSFSPDGKTLAGVTGRGTVTLWDVATRRVKVGLPDGGGSRNVVFSPDGRLLANPGKLGDIRLSEAATGRTVHTLTDATGEGVAFSPDGKTLAAPDSDGTHSLRLWDTATGRSTVAFDRTEDDLVASVAFSPDGKTIVSWGHGNVIKLWDVSSRRIRAVLIGHSGQVNTVVFSPDGKRIASGSQDKTIRIWNLAG